MTSTTLIVGAGFAGSVVARELAEIDELSYVVITAGRYDIIAEFVAKDDDHLIELMSDRIRTIAGVGSTEMLGYLKLQKQTYSWGTH